VPPYSVSVSNPELRPQRGTAVEAGMSHRAMTGAGPTLQGSLAIYRQEMRDELDFDVAIPGHGPLLTKAEVRAFRDKMQTLNQRMADLIRSGGGKQDIAGRLKLDDLDWPFPDGGLNGLFDELSKR